MFCAIWYHLYNLKNVKNTHREGLSSTILEHTFYEQVHEKFHMDNTE